MKIYQKIYTNPIVKRSLLLVFLLLCVYALYTPLELRHYTIQAEQPLQQPLQIALISDTHSSTLYYTKMLAILQQNIPDIIVLTGDIIDDETDPNLGFMLFDLLKEAFPSLPMYYVTGNHEFHQLGATKYKEVIAQKGFIVLDAHHPFDIIALHGTRLLIAGVDDPSITYYDMYGARIANKEDKGSVEWKKHYLTPLQAVKKQNADYKILLTHRAEFIADYKDLPFDLVLAGHAHGGQVRIPLLLEQGLYAPSQGFFPQYTGGVFPLDTYRHLVVSRGASFELTRPRVFNPAEVVYITII